MLLTIQHNPYAEEPELLFETLKLETGMSYINETKPDIQALSDLQALISPNMKK